MIFLINISLNWQADSRFSVLYELLTSIAVDTLLFIVTSIRNPEIAYNSNDAHQIHAPPFLKIKISRIFSCETRKSKVGFQAKGYHELI